MIYKLRAARVLELLPVKLREVSRASTRETDNAGHSQKDKGLNLP